MNILKKIYCRIFQTCFRIALPVLPYREPELIDGFKHVPEVLKKHHISHILLVTDPGVYKLGLTKPLEKQLLKSEISCTIYKDTVANPTSANIEEAKDLYLAHGCQALLAFGGGSSMDCAKGVGARLARPKQITGQDGRHPSCHAQAAPADRRSLPQPEPEVKQHWPLSSPMPIPITNTRSTISA